MNRNPRYDLEDAREELVRIENSKRNFGDVREYRKLLEEREHQVRNQIRRIQRRIAHNRQY